MTKIKSASFTEWGKLIHNITLIFPNSFAEKHLAGFSVKSEVISWQHNGSAG